MRRPKTPAACGSLRPIGEVAADVVRGVAVGAVSHWLRQADELTGRDRTTCLETADAILRMAGLRWGDFLPRKAA